MEKHITIKSGQPWLFGVDVQENSGGAPEARSRLCVLSGFLPRDLFHGRDSSRWLLAGAPSHQVLCVLPQVYSSIPGVVSRPRGSRPSHPLPLALTLARAGRHPGSAGDEQRQDEVGMGRVSQARCFYCFLPTILLGSSGTLARFCP